MHMAAIADQFKGLDMGSLIGGPLTAAADASIMLADSTADFINHVGLFSRKSRPFTNNLQIY